MEELIYRLGFLSIGGLGSVILTNYLNNRKSKLEYVMELHKTWWNSDFQKARRNVYEVAKDITFKSSKDYTDETNYFLKCASENKLNTYKTGRQFIKIVFFFADLNACLDQGIVDKKLAYRLFGASQYEHFRPLIKRTREEIEKCYSSNLSPVDISIRWIKETKELDTIFVSEIINEKYNYSKKIHGS